MNIQDSTLFTVRSRRDRYTIGALLTLIVMTALVVLAHYHRMPPLTVAAPATPTTANVNLSKLPLYFIENRGQSDEQVAYYLQGRDASVYFTADGITLALQEPAPAVEKDAVQPLHRLARPEPATAETVRQRWAVKVQFVGAEPVKPQGRSKTATIVSYFKGPQTNWKTGLPTYTEVAYSNVWPGIEVVYSGDGGRLKTTFHVQPGADPRQIQLAYQGATNVTLTDAGRLAIQTPVGGFEEERPVVYQEIDGRRIPVEARYTLAQTETGDWRYGFSLGAYDPSRPLVIDPAILVYCGYIGGASSDTGKGIAVDSMGQVYVVGTTESTEATFPVRGGPDLTFNDYWMGKDAFVAKISADGSQLIYAGYIGGGDHYDDYGRGIAVDEMGQAYVVGDTWSPETSFPVRGGPDLTYNGYIDAFVAKVSADGSQLLYAGYIGGEGGDYGGGIAVDGLGQAYVVGDTDSSEATFPVRNGPDLTYNDNSWRQDAFVAKVSADGSQLIYAGYIGGDHEDYGRGIAVDGLGQAYVVGDTASRPATFPVRGGPDLTRNDDWEQDAFVAKVSADGAQLIYAGYIGGSGSETGSHIAVDNLGQAYVIGWTNSTQATFPVRGGPDLTHNGDDDSFVAKVSADGAQLLYAGYIGGDYWDHSQGIAVDELGQAYVVGTTQSTEATFPVRGGPDLTRNGDWGQDAFVAKVSADGSQLIYAGYIGGNQSDYGVGIAVNQLGQAYVVGDTESPETSFPVRGGPDLTYNGSYAADAFVAKLTDTDLALSMSAAPNPVSVGQSLSYTLTVSNNGPQDVPDVVVTDTLPVGVDFSNASTGCTYEDSSRKVTCAVGVLTVKVSTGVTLTVKPTAQSPSTIQNTATVTSATVIDNDLANNQAQVTTQMVTYLLKVTKRGNGSGTVSSSPSGINCGSDCTENYLSGDSVTLTASPASNSTFTGWSGTCSGKGTCEVSMTQARSVTATFAVKTYALMVRKAGNGSGVVSSSPAGINCGSDCSESYTSGKKVKFTAKAKSGSVFAGWSGACSGTSSTCTVTMNQAKTVTAAFTKKGYYLLTVSKAGSGSGTVTSSPSGINCGSDCNHSYRNGTKVKLTAKAKSGSVFAGWKGSCSGRSATCQVTLSKTRGVTATFNRRSAASSYDWQEFLNPQENGGDADSTVNPFLREGGGQ